MMQSLFTVLIIVQFLAVVLHDWLHIPGWTHGRQVFAELGPAKMWMGTALNAVFPGLAAGFALYYREKPTPSFVLTYWLIYCVVTAIWAIQAWWIPYWRCTDEKTKTLYSKMYAGTIQVLPARGDNPSPNILHLCFHALFLATLTLSAILRFRTA
jgi:ammonia channel protein AmtB